jgi:uncharacterized protein YjbI with pentapeptide repeats
MANQEQLVLLQQGVKRWNTWRAHHEETSIDLSGAKLSGIFLNGAHLREANLSRSNLSGADLSGADLSGADLSRAHLREANLRNASLIIASLSNVDLIRADLTSALLSGADLSNALLSGADLSLSVLNKTDLSGALLDGALLDGALLDGAILNRADLRGATLVGVILDGADLSEATIGRSIFGNVDFRMVKGLETVIHRGPSEISTSTLARSQGNISEIFLRGAGLDDASIHYARALITNPTEYYTCFISHASKDGAFAERLYTNLQNGGIRCWLASEGLKSSEKFRQRTDGSLRRYDILLLVLSEHSVNSQWVEKEVEAAFKKEHQHNALALFAIKLDETVMSSDKAWAGKLRRERHIIDFALWKEHDEYFKSVEQLIRDIKAGWRPQATNPSTHT